ncbi:DUF4400 domain-containing protein [Citrobacter werkmanii]|uniref:DUF4400 domain-containing protein n=1 Tax=Citrobacter werkmanii TaxID=67827 RepID=UPI0037CA3BD4
MSQQQPTLPSQPPSGLVIGLLRLVGYVLVIIIEGVFLHLLLTLFIYFLWPQDDVEHISRAVLYEQAALEQDLRWHPLKTHILGLLQYNQIVLRHTEEIVFSLFKQRELASSLSPVIRSITYIMFYSMQSVMTRMLRLIITFPLFLFCMTMGMVEGLVLRDLRRFGAGYESTLILNRLISIIGKTCKYIIIINLSAPDVLSSLKIDYLSFLSAGVMIYYLLLCMNIRGRL